MADSTVAATVRSGSWRAITGYQWLVFVVVWLGWTLDAADFGLFSLVLQPALRNLLGFAATGVLPPEQMAQIGKYGGLLIMTERCYGAGDKDMATSSLHVTDGVPRCPSRTT